MFNWLRRLLEKEVELTYAPPYMFPVGSLFFYYDSTPTGIYRVTRHQPQQQWDNDAVLCFGVLQLPLTVPLCVGCKLTNLLNQKECDCNSISNSLRNFHNEGCKSNATYI